MNFLLNHIPRDFPGGPVVHTSTAGGAHLISGRGTKIPHAEWHSQKNKKKPTYLYNSFF